MAALPDATKLGQLLMPLATENELGDLRALAELRLVGGAALLGSPGAGLPATLEDVQAAAGELPLFLASDEEGGSVQRLGSLLGPLPSAANVASTMTPDQARDLAAGYGAGMAELGFNMVLAPVVDIGGGPGIGSRSYSESPAAVVDYAGAAIDGYVEAGLIPVLKHFPGHGRASGDSHVVLPTTPPIGDLAQTDLVPYQELLGRSGIAVMVGHLDVPGLSSGIPTSLSGEAVDGLLRGELGFDGLVLTDSIVMGALSGYPPGEAVRLALTAGADVMIVGSPSAVPQLVADLLGYIDSGSLTWETVEDSVLRILEAKEVDACDLAQR